MTYTEKDRKMARALMGTLMHESAMYYHDRSAGHWIWVGLLVVAAAGIVAALGGF